MFHDVSAGYECPSVSWSLGQSLDRIDSCFLQNAKDDVAAERKAAQADREAFETARREDAAAFEDARAALIRGSKEVRG